MLINNLKSIWGRVMLMTALVLSPLAQANEDVVIIEGTRITGNQESPTILYVIPWQAPGIDALETAGSVPKIEHHLQPIERSEFIRLIEYHDHFKNRLVNNSAGDTAR